MTDYLHHVPGRLRIRSKAFRCSSVEQGAVLRRVRTFEGVRSVRHNAKAGSVTVCYDKRVAAPDEIIGFIDAACVKVRAVRPVVARAKPSAEKSNSKLPEEIRRIALSALINRGVGYSLSTLLGARI